MAGSINKVILVGNLGRDPEVRSFQNGGRVANLSIATSERWKDRSSGEQRERTQWHRIAIFAEPLVKTVEQYLRKGSKIYLEGQLETRQYTDQQGVEKTATEVVLRPYSGELVMLDGRGDGGGGQTGSAGPAPASATAGPADPAGPAPDAGASRSAPDPQDPVPSSAADAPDPEDDLPF